MKKRVLVVTDMNFQGSGYFNIAVPLFTELSGEFNVTIVGFGYERQEHNYPFSIICALDLNDIFAEVNNLILIPETTPDVIVVAMDIPQQIQFYEKFEQYKKPYIAITPLENPPISFSTTAKLMKLDYIFFISELGKTSALAAGLKNVDHLEIGVDTNFWHIPTKEEKKGLRKGMGIEDDEFVILTVADNQERKNLWASMAIVSEVKRMGHKVRYIMVTRTDVPFGLDIRDMALVLGINKELMTLNRGMPLDNLWSLYALSDCFLLTSKAEGLGMPVLEAMSCGLPCVTTDTGALHELLSDNRGFLIPPDYSFIDVWMNSRRDMASVLKGAEIVSSLIGKDTDVWQNAREFMESKTWARPVALLGNKIRELTEKASNES